MIQYNQKGEVIITDKNYKQFHCQNCKASLGLTNGKVIIMSMSSQADKVITLICICCQYRNIWRPLLS